MNYRHLAVEGNIGSGKTTLARMLAEHYGTRLALEEFEDNHLLPKFYSDPLRYGFALELSFLADRFSQLKGLLPPDLFQEKLVTDYALDKSRLFARVNLKDDEYALFHRFFDMIHPQLPPPDLMIYLHAPVGKLRQHIRQRGRSYEQDIPDDYLERIQEAYQQYLKQDPCRIIILDAANADFASQPDHFRQLTDFLGKNYDFRQHYLAIN